jgi:hypothetical protein
MAWEEIGQLTGSMGLVRKEARHHALKATIFSTGYFIAEFNLPYITCVYVNNTG